MLATVFSCLKRQRKKKKKSKVKSKAEVLCGLNLLKTYMRETGGGKEGVGHSLARRTNMKCLKRNKDRKEAEE